MGRSNKSERACCFPALERASHALRRRPVPTMPKTKTKFDRIAFRASELPEAVAAGTRLAALYGDADPAEADAIVALGGDGHMLQTLHRFMNDGIPIYGMNRRSAGFLMNGDKAEQSPA